MSNYKLEFEKDTEYKRDIEQYGMTFEEWVTQMEENADNLENEYHIKRQEELIAKFKERHSNGAIIDVNATLEEDNQFPDGEYTIKGLEDWGSEDY